MKNQDSFFSYTPEGMANILQEEYKCRDFVAKQLLEWVYQRSVFDFEQMSNLPKELRQKLKERFVMDLPTVSDSISTKESGTEKITLKLFDGKLVESVFMREGKQITLCLSSQVGCAQACIFCATGKMGILRNLTAGEIVAQILLWRQRRPKDMEGGVRLVFMGMGEPFHNMNQLFKALDVITSPLGLNIGARKITVSTSGVVKGIYRLMEYNPQIQLAISLHSVEQAVRDRWVPNCKDRVDDILKAARDFNKKTHRKVTFEMVIFGGDHIQTSRINKIGKVLQGIHCNINLIPYNPIKELQGNFVRPSFQETEYFKSILKRHQKEVTVRISKGRDIQAACGQLIPKAPDSTAGSNPVKA
ncbi:MAG: 23S rRNA (adenine(2503)-C(2))-methyltransferase RlmN [Candidatus Cloacimonetes bacterium]|nr:23S rRNA (adenine(2503)-C(2))-methyltransferase RlmN [Candidatus Cloacimonadota bacterium]